MNVIFFSFAFTTVSFNYKSRDFILQVLFMSVTSFESSFGAHFHFFTSAIAPYLRSLKHLDALKNEFYSQSIRPCFFITGGTFRKESEYLRSKPVESSYFRTIITRVWNLVIEMRSHAFSFQFKYSFFQCEKDSSSQGFHIDFSELREFIC